jgi:hypothetical protein
MLKYWIWQNEWIHIVNSEGLAPWSIVLLEKLTVTQLVTKYPTFYGTWGFIIMFTRALHWSLSWAKWLHTFHPISVRSIPILSPHLHLGLPLGLFSSGFLTKILYAFLISPIHATYPAYLILYHPHFLLPRLFLQNCPILRPFVAFHNNKIIDSLFIYYNEHKIVKKLS